MFQERINYDGDISLISKAICKDYNLGEFVSHKVIQLGYEDFNLVLETSVGKYFVKIFAKFRDLANCQRYIDVMVKMVKSGVSIPKLFKSSKGYLHEIEGLHLCVMEFIDGDNLYNLDIDIVDVKFLARQAALINSIDIKPEFVYDSWAITSLSKEFSKKSKCLSESDLKLIEPLVSEFATLDISKLPHCFVHGDILSTNVMKSDKLFIIDFSVSNYYPRVQELAVLACESCYGHLDVMLAEYQKYVKLTSYELEVLPLYIKLAHAMHLLSANYEKVVLGNKSEENEYWLKIGRDRLPN
jgi:Ser/Thr protein kinase RdoA (MazF antagonist)